MKMIHCADLHLDAKMKTHLDGMQAKERRLELLGTFGRLVSYAAEHKVRAILIAGDLFDTKNITKTTKNAVLNEFRTHPGILFYYLRGNHDSDDFLEGEEELPENLKLFSTEWSCYEVDENVCIYGAEFSGENGRLLYPALLPDPEKINIVMLHGQEAESDSKDKTEIVQLRALQNKGIDYLALGHIHSYKQERLDGRGVYCYSGCLEGRGFDECGEHGFVLLDIDEEKKTVTGKFVPFAKRKLYTVTVDVSGCQTSAEMAERARRYLAETGCEAGSLIKLVLAGEIEVECEKNPEYICQTLAPDYYFLKVEDETRLHVDWQEFAQDISLKGEFVRTVQKQTDLSEEDKHTIIRYGLQILEGEKEVEA